LLSAAPSDEAAAPEVDAAATAQAPLTPADRALVEAIAAGIPDPLGLSTSLVGQVVPCTLRAAPGGQGVIPSATAPHEHDQPETAASGG